MNLEYLLHPLAFMCNNNIDLMCDESLYIREKCEASLSILQNIDTILTFELVNEDLYEIF